MYGQDDKLPDHIDHIFDSGEDTQERTEPTASSTAVSQTMAAMLPYAQMRPPRNTTSTVNPSEITGLSSAASSYSISDGGLGSAGFQAGSTWHTQTQSPLYSSAAESVAASTNPSLTSFDYQPYGEERQAHHVGNQAMLFSGNYLASPTSDQQMAYAYGWDTMNPTSLGSDLATFQPGIGMGEPSVPSMGMATPVSFTSASSSGRYPEAHSERTSVHGSESSLVGDGRISRLSDPRGKGKERRQPKRAKSTSHVSTSAPASKQPSISSGTLSPLLPPTPAESAASGSRSVAGSRARRVSRSVASQPPSPQDDKKPRNSHNMVEKQYRNRLNAQFEGLMNALPESLRSSSNNEEVGYGEAGTDESPEKRASKAEVLDMARRHIQSLEQERDMLERDRDELLETMKNLKKEYDAGGSSSDAT